MKKIIKIITTNKGIQSRQTMQSVEETLENNNILRETRKDIYNTKTGCCGKEQLENNKE